MDAIKAQALIGQYRQLLRDATKLRLDIRAIMNRATSYNNPEAITGYKSGLTASALKAINAKERALWRIEHKQAEILQLAAANPVSRNLFAKVGAFDSSDGKTERSIKG